jgi:hypothetical protein
MDERECHALRDRMSPSSDGLRSGSSESGNLELIGDFSSVSEFVKSAIRRLLPNLRLCCVLLLVVLS